MAKSENQVPEHTVRPSGLPWEIIAQSSLTFAGVTAVLFIVGWSYYSGWYGYYGVNMTQVDIPIQHIFIQSYIPLLILLSTLGISMIIYGMGRSIFTILKMGGFKKTYIKSYGSVAREFSVDDWIGVLVIDSLLNYFAFNIIFDAPIRMLNLPVNALNETVYYGISVIILILVIGLAVFALIGAIFFYISGIPFRELTRTIGVMLPIHPPKPTWIFGLFIVNIIISMSLSQRYGVLTAAAGVEGFGSWKIQTVNLAYPGELETPDWMKLGCEQTSCLYGPFGLVAENTNSYILVPLVRHAGAIVSDSTFIIPKSDQVSLVPNDQQKILTPPTVSTP